MSSTLSFPPVLNQNFVGRIIYLFIPVWWPGEKTVPLQPMQIVKGDQNGYPVPGGIDGSPCLGGCKFGGLALQVEGWSTGRQPVTDKNLTVRKPNL